MRMRERVCIVISCRINSHGVYVCNRTLTLHAEGGVVPTHRGRFGPIFHALFCSCGRIRSGTGRGQISRLRHVSRLIEHSSSMTQSIAARRVRCYARLVRSGGGAELSVAAIKRSKVAYMHTSLLRSKWCKTH